MRQSFRHARQGRMKIVTSIDWDDDGTPTLFLRREGRMAAVSLNDAHRFTDEEPARHYAGAIASALGLDYWSAIDRNAVLDCIYRNLDDLVAMPPPPKDGLEHRKMLEEGGIARMELRHNGKTVMETGL